jgi:hypothetical protein
MNGEPCCRSCGEELEFPEQPECAECGEAVCPQCAALCHDCDGLVCAGCASDCCDCGRTLCDDCGIWIGRQHFCDECVEGEKANFARLAVDEDRRARQWAESLCRKKGGGA